MRIVQQAIVGVRAAWGDAAGGDLLPEGGDDVVVRDELLAVSAPGVDFGLSVDEGVEVVACCLEGLFHLALALAVDRTNLAEVVGVEAAHLLLV